MKMKNKKFDERQLWIRGNIFQHMVIVFVILLFLNAFLSSYDIIWADGFHSSIIIILAAVAVGSVEMIFREVYFTNSIQQIFLIILIAGCALFTLILNILHTMDGEKIISDGTLTDTGGFLIMSVLMLNIGLSGLIKMITGLFKK